MTRFLVPTNTKVLYMFEIKVDNYDEIYNRVEEEPIVDEPVILEEGDLVLVPTRDAATGRDIVRKVAVAHGNHFVCPEHIKHPLKKIIAIIKRRAAHALTPNANEKIEKREKETAAK